MVLEIIKPWIFPKGQPALKENHSVPMDLAEYHFHIFPW